MDTQHTPFADLMLLFRARYPSEVKAAEALKIGATTLSDYCRSRSVPTGAGIMRLAPLVGVSVVDLAAMVGSQRLAMGLAPRVGKRVRDRRKAAGA